MKRKCKPSRKTFINQTSNYPPNNSSALAIPHFTMPMDDNMWKACVAKVNLLHLFDTHDYVGICWFRYQCNRQCWRAFTRRHRWQPVRAEGTRFDNWCNSQHSRNRNYCPRQILSASTYGWSSTWRWSKLTTCVHLFVRLKSFTKYAWCLPLKLMLQHKQCCRQIVASYSIGWCWHDAFRLSSIIANTNVRSVLNVHMYYTGYTSRRIGNAQIYPRKE